MNTPVHAFRADYITAAIAEIVDRSAACHPVDTDTIAVWRSYAQAAEDLGFVSTAQMWSSIVSHATELRADDHHWMTAREVQEGLLSDWTRLGLNNEQAWQAMWLV